MTDLTGGAKGAKGLFQSRNSLPGTHKYIVIVSGLGKGIRGKPVHYEPEEWHSRLEVEACAHAQHGDLEGGRGHDDNLCSNVFVNSDGILERIFEVEQLVCLLRMRTD